MTFDAQETSIEDVAPIELFQFGMGATNWRFTNVEDDVQVGAATYTAANIRRGEVKQQEEIQKSNLTLETPRDNPVAQLFIADNPPQVVSLTLFRLHRTDANEEVQTLWKGRVLKVTFNGLNAEMECEPIFVSLERPGLRRHYQTLCPHVLYGDECRAVASNFQVQATLTSVSGTQLVASEFATKPDGWFVAGRVEHPNGAKEMVVAHVGDTITLVSALYEAAVGDVIDAFAGCDHTMTTCDQKFDNLENFGGFPYVPGRSPFSGTPIM